MSHLSDRGGKPFLIEPFRPVATAQRVEIQVQIWRPLGSNLLAVLVSNLRFQSPTSTLTLPFPRW
jgi:hypothetical protein